MSSRDPLFNLWRYSRVERRDAVGRFSGQQVRVDISYLRRSSGKDKPDRTLCGKVVTVAVGMSGMQQDFLILARNLSDQTFAVPLATIQYLRATDGPDPRKDTTQ